MTINEAIEDLFSSSEFKEQQSTNSTLRKNYQRYKSNELKTGAIVDLLISFGYTITVKRGKKQVLAGPKKNNE